MKISFDDSGNKLTIDFEGLKIDIPALVNSDMAGGMDFINSLFNWDVLSEVRNGYWQFSAVDGTTFERPVSKDGEDIFGEPTNP